MPNVQRPIDLTKCPCGQPLHYSDPHNEERISAMVARLGWAVKVTGSKGRAWMVPRHYIALHGVAEADLEYLAAAYGFQEVRR